MGSLYNDYRGHTISNYSQLWNFNLIAFAIEFLFQGYAAEDSLITHKIQTFVSYKLEPKSRS